MSGNVPYGKVREAMHQHAAGDTSAPLTPTMNRVLSAAQHAASLTNEYEGGSFRLHGQDSGQHIGPNADRKAPALQPYSPGDPYTMVGGMPDKRTGKAFPTQMVDYGSPSPRANAGDIIDARKKMVAASSSPDAVLGTWTSVGGRGENRVDIDMSTKFSDSSAADTAVIDRNEDAHFSMKDFSEKTNQQIRDERGLGPRPEKEKGQEEIVRRHKP